MQDSYSTNALVWNWSWNVHLPSLLLFLVFVSVGGNNKEREIVFVFFWVGLRNLTREIYKLSKTNLHSLALTTCTQPDVSDLQKHERALLSFASYVWGGKWFRCNSIYLRKTIYITKSTLKYCLSKNIFLVPLVLISALFFCFSVQSGGSVEIAM